MNLLNTHIPFSQRFVDFTLPLLAKTITEHDMKRADNHGNTPLHYAAMMVDTHTGLTLSRLYLEKGADPTAKNDSGYMPYQLALLGSWSIIGQKRFRCLLRNGCIVGDTMAAQVLSFMYAFELLDHDKINGDDCQVCDPVHVLSTMVDKDDASATYRQRQVSAVYLSSSRNPALALKLFTQRSDWTLGEKQLFIRATRFAMDLPVFHALRQSILAA